MTYKIRVFQLTLATVIGLALGRQISAEPLVTAGQFNLGGTVYITSTSFLFGYFSVPSATSADQKSGVLLPASGPFSDLIAGEIVSMHNLLTPSNGNPFGPGPVLPGTPFVLKNFIQLPDGIDIDLTGFPVNQGLSVCSGTAFDLPGGTCRAQAASPIVLQQGNSGVTAIMNFSGEAHYATSSIYTALDGKFSASFASPAESTISGLLASFDQKGFLTTGYQVNFSTSGPFVPTPEPGSFFLIGASLFGFAGLALARRTGANCSGLKTGCCGVPPDTRGTF